MKYNNKPELEKDIEKIQAAIDSKTRQMRNSQSSNDIRNLQSDIVKLNNQLETMRNILKDFSKIKNKEYYAYEKQKYIVQNANLNLIFQETIRKQILGVCKILPCATCPYSNHQRSNRGICLIKLIIDRTRVD